jgi:hypothetical protein
VSVLWDVVVAARRLQRAWASTTHPVSSQTASSRGRVNRRRHVDGGPGGGILPAMVGLDAHGAVGNNRRNRCEHGSQRAPTLARRTHTRLTAVIAPASSLVAPPRLPRREGKQCPPTLKWPAFDRRHWPTFRPALTPSSPILAGAVQRAPPAMANPYARGLESRIPSLSSP